MSHSVSMIKSKKRRNARKLLILDLNNVLVHRQKMSSIFTVRPFADSFLAQMAEIFTLAVWTSMKGPNAKKVIKELFAERGIKLSFQWYQSRCTQATAVIEHENGTINPRCDGCDSSTLGNDRHSTSFREQTQAHVELPAPSIENKGGHILHEVCAEGSSTCAEVCAEGDGEVYAKVDRIETARVVIAQQEGRKPDKPLFLKELAKVWAVYPQYSEDNTVLLDDSAEKCVLNPLFCSIHPAPYIPSHFPSTSSVSRSSSSECIGDSRRKRLSVNAINGRHDRGSDFVPGGQSGSTHNWDARTTTAESHMCAINNGPNQIAARTVSEGGSCFDIVDPSKRGTNKRKRPDHPANSGAGEPVGIGDCRYDGDSWCGVKRLQFVPGKGLGRKSSERLSASATEGLLVGARADSGADYEAEWRAECGSNGTAVVLPNAAGKARPTPAPVFTVRGEQQKDEGERGSGSANATEVRGSAMKIDREREEREDGSSSKEEERAIEGVRESKGRRKEAGEGDTDRELAADGSLVAYLTAVAAFPGPLSQFTAQHGFYQWQKDR